MFKKFLGKEPSQPEKEAAAPAAPLKGQPRPVGGAGLAQLLVAGMELPQANETLLKEGMEKGLEFFEHFNNSRLELAFGAFDEVMKKALYEVLFLLHVNDPSLAGVKFTAIRRVEKDGVMREKEVGETADLYVENAPHGVEGIDRLSPVFKEEFDKQTQQVFGQQVSPQSSYGHNPIVSIHSLGSIGTVGHKSRASDLDLQVQYELEPFLLDPHQWSDTTFKEALSREVASRVNRLRVEEGLPPEAVKDPKTRQMLMNRASHDVGGVFPNLWRYLVTRQGDYSQELPSNGHLKGQVTQELMTLMKRAQRLSDNHKKKESLFKERLGRIQQYIMDKYPAAEIYLFSCSNDDYRRGFHGTTLESKEASGSAYELILNFDTLMPGIQLTPMVPSHFVLPQNVNSDRNRYDKLMDLIRFDMLGLYRPVRDRLVNLGPTPDMTMEYVGNHGGAVYWEAFKASSGNLPKATLNLFRIEMLLDKRFIKTIIQLIKEPTILNQYVTPKPVDPTAEIEAMVAGKTGLPPWAAVEMEPIFPLLLQDPWWLRYKALKIAFHEPQGVEGLEPDERMRASAVVDQAFALHVRISDVFTKPGDTRPFDTHREKFLLEFLRRAFPPVSERRKQLEHMFIGEVHAVTQFENTLRELFKRSLKRVNEKIAKLNLKGEGNKKEFEIWFHYYQQNFEPAPNVVQRTIMGHLKTPRGRLQVGYKPGEGWFFISMQKESTVGKRFDTFGMLDHMPDEVGLLEQVGFLEGLAHCIINGYYGVLNKGTLRESRTVLEFHPKFMDLGNRIDNQFAFIRPDNVERILHLVLTSFPYQPYHYMDCVRLKRKITEVLIFLNLFSFGRLSILYRDNLRTWYVDEFDHKEIHNQAQTLQGNRRAVFMAKPLHMTLAGFFKQKGIFLDDVRLAVWVNPNSLDTAQGPGKGGRKEEELAVEFLGVINHVHGPKPAPGQGAVAPAEPEKAEPEKKEPPVEG